MSGRFQQGRRRIMDKFRIDEISAVDFPAQEGAVALLMKRKTEPARPVAKRCGELVLITSAVDGHAHGLALEPGQRGGSTWYAKGPEEEYSHDHAWVMDAEGNLTIAMNEGHQHDVPRAALLEGFLRLNAEARASDAVVAMARKAEIEFTQDGGVIDLVTKCRYDSDGVRKGDVMPEPKTKPSLEDLEKRQGELETRLELSQLYGSFNDAERTHFDGLDQVGKAAFAKADKAGRAALLEKASESDPVVYKDRAGVEYRKSAGDHVIALAKRADAAEKRADEQAEKAASADLRKRAEDVFGDLPGDRDAHVAGLRALEKIEDEGLRKAAIEAVQAGAKAIKAAFTKVGHRSASDPVTGDADEQLEKLAKARQKEKGISYEDAYDQVGEENPDLLERAIAGE